VLYFCLGLATKVGHDKGNMLEECLGLKYAHASV
jgi:hypothetical protein